MDLLLSPLLLMTAELSRAAGGDSRKAHRSQKALPIILVLQGVSKHTKILHPQWDSHLITSPKELHHQSIPTWSHYPRI